MIVIPSPPHPVKYFIGALFSDETLLKEAVEQCTNCFGAVDFTSEQFLFESTDYYEPEMGSPIHRQFFSFENLKNPSLLATAKIQTNNIEQDVKTSGTRKVNLDIGYMDFHKIVLASAKYNGQKIYLDHGIYADPTLYYEKGQFYPHDWAFPDFQETEQYYPALLRIRELYKLQLKNAQSQDKPNSD
ncbi:MAG: DUF4416 family protein [Candidatus Marinimicrobia bacterium]|nr:DUF4416 family protein [Candidatus Neomarinimicrobiota bacterium]